MKVFVTSYGRPDMLETCLKSLARFELDITVIDNMENGNEFRHLAAWGLELTPNEPYIVTDSDIAITEDCPDDVIDKMLEVLDRFPNVMKVGLGINTANFPDPPPVTSPPFPTTHEAGFRWRRRAMGGNW